MMTQLPVHMKLQRGRETGKDVINMNGCAGDEPRKKNLVVTLITLPSLSPWSQCKEGWEVGVRDGQLSSLGDSERE